MNLILVTRCQFLQILQVSTVAREYICIYLIQIYNGFRLAFYTCTYLFPLLVETLFVISELEGYKLKYTNLFVTLVYCLSNVVMNHVWLSASSVDTGNTHHRPGLRNRSREAPVIISS